MTLSDAAANTKAENCTTSDDRENLRCWEQQCRGSKKMAGSKNTSFSENELMLFLASRKSFRYHELCLNNYENNVTTIRL